MKKMGVSILCNKLLFTILSILAPILLAVAEADSAVHHLQFEQLSTPQALPTNEVQKVYQDKDGFMWFATRNGLCRYDGYETTLYKSNLYSPGLLTNNSITCLADDGNDLWIGTAEGLNALNKKTGEVRKYLLYPSPNSVVSALCVTRDGTVWLGTDEGLCRYIPGEDTFARCGGDFAGGRLTFASVKSLFEDSDGDLWIGTWAQGLYRYSPSTGKVEMYPQLNERNSSHAIYEDSHKNIWVGSWGCGLFRLENPKDMKRVSYVGYLHKAGDETSLSDNIVYDIGEDTNSHALWVGTRSGLSILDLENPQTFINYRPGKSTYRIPSDEINSILRDDQDNMWIGTIGGGVLKTNTHEVLFNLHTLNFGDEDIPVTSVRALFADADRNLWIGVGTYGLARKEYATGELKMYSQIPEFSEVTALPSLTSVLQRKKNGDLWFGLYNGGIYIYRKGEKVRHLVEENCDFLISSSVSALYEDEEGNCWVGMRGGLGVSLADGTSYRFDKMQFADSLSVDWIYVRDIVKDPADQSVWVATSNWGVIHITGDIRQPATLKYENYSYNNAQLITNTVFCLHIDRTGRLWAGTEGGGLYLYDRENRRFEEKNQTYNIPGDVILSMEEDESGGLWLSTNSALVNLKVTAVSGEFSTRVYTSADGLQENMIVSSSCSDGEELFFGGHSGYNSFSPDKMDVSYQEVRFLITDMKIFNHSYAGLPPELRREISPVMPTYARYVELPYEYNNFSIEFAALTYKNPELNRFAYRLLHFDPDWLYTDAERRFAYYNNLPAGTYTFQLKATNENGVWSSGIRELTVVVLPPPWATWWAYVLYVIVSLGIIYIFYRIAKNRILLRNELRVREIEKARAEELNHAKLQFFTNITHELLTPLTIISASVDELKIQAPAHNDLYTVMSSNVQRLIRLLQQILEFRKAESGNLKLRVSLGDMAAFVKKEAESFSPLARKRKIHFSVLCDPESIIGYFDIDKLDKILYNLLSNAAKYNKEGGFIQITLTCDEDKDFVLLRIKDDGDGFSKEKQETLFKRFYEGDYRKFNTIGTGIGLSLTKDLVKLHEGTIRVDSEEGKGTEFLVRLPIDRSYYREEQIDKDIVSPIQKMTNDYGEQEETVNAQMQIREANPNILVVEDNEDLLQLMVKLLGQDYNIFTAGNGKEGIAVLENEDIDLIVSDVMMPEMDGIAFCKYVKSNLEISHVPIILLTAKSKEEDRAEAYETGADAFIGKPFHLPVLYARIRNLLKQRQRMAHDFKNQLVFEMKGLNYTSLDEDFIKRAVECVNNHLEDGEFDQPQFVVEMRTSKSTLYKKLKSLTGLNTSAFIRNVRLKAACRMMEEKGANIRISELAYAVGFNDPKYFSACFKKEFGMLPSEYVERFIQGEDK